MAAEILCTRWTVVLLRELMAGSTRFNELRRGVRRMSPALLSQRLKELEAAGIIMPQASDTEPGVFEYHLTEAGMLPEFSAASPASVADWTAVIRPINV